MSTNFLFSKVYWQHPAMFAFTPQAHFPAHNLNFHWSWRWLDWIQAIFLNLFYFNDCLSCIHPCSGSGWLATICHQFFGTKSTSAGLTMTRSSRGSSAQGYRIQNCLAITRRSISLKKSVKAMPSTSFLWQSKSDSVWGHIISLIVHETRRICSPWDWCLVPDQACSQQCATNFLEQRAHLRA